MLALWLAAGVLDGPDPVAPPVSGPSGGSLWWRETLPRRREPPADALPAPEAALAASNTQALILLLT